MEMYYTITQFIYWYGVTEFLKFQADSCLKIKFVAEDIPADAAERVSLLAVAWDRKVQVAKLVKSKLKVCGKWSLDSTAIGVAWLDDRVCIICQFICF